MAPGNRPVLLSIVELGGYPNYSPLYQQAGFSVVATDSVRKAVKLIRKHRPAVIVAEFNFQSDFRDRTSSLETLLATLQGQYPDCKVIVFYEKEFATAFARLQQSYPIDCALQFPVSDDKIRAALTRFAQQGTSDA